MKFGKHFANRSVPAWKSYNIDYAALKAVVKQRTSSSATGSRAIDISTTANANGADQWQLLEKETLRLLAGEIERTSKFVKSKRLEIESRLNGIDQQLEHVRNNHQLTTRNATGLRRRFNLVAQKIQDVGDDIRLLSRFVSANKTAVTKLVKKYVKWSGLESLSGKVAFILAQPESFASAPLAPLMDRYESQLVSIRYLYSKHEGTRPTARRMESYSSNTTSEELYGASKYAAISFDMAMDATQEAAVEKRATYWVHYDNILELRVLLIQSLKQLMPPERVAQLVYDDLQAYPSRLDAQSRPLPNLNAFITTGQVALQINADGGPSQAARIELSQLQDFTTDTAEWNRPDTAPMDDEDRVARDVAAEARQQVHSWLVSNRSSTELLLKACYQRTRFVELRDGLGTNTRVTLDEDISFMPKPSAADLTDPSVVLDPTGSPHAFKHAVLTVRYCDLDKSLPSILDHSHLTERVDEFSIGTQGTHQCYGDNYTQKPLWISKLAKDIRHVPANGSEDSNSRKSSILGAGGATGRLASGSSDFSRLNGEETPETELSSNANRSSIGKFVSKPKPQTRFDLPPQKAPLKKQQEEVHYWNEYDDGSEFGGDEGFVVYIDPDAPVYPGQKQIEKFWGDLTQLFSKSKKPNALDVARANAARETDSDDRSPTYTSSSDDDDDDDEPGSRHIFKKPQPERRQSQMNGSVRRYSTFPAFQPTLLPSQDARGQGFKTAVICLTSSLVILMLLGALQIAAKKKFQSQVALVTLVGACISLLFGVVGVVKTLPPSAAVFGSKQESDEEAQPILSYPGYDETPHDEELGRVRLGKAVVSGLVFVVIALGNGWLVASALQA